MVANKLPSDTVWLGIFETTGGSFTAVTVKVAGSLSDKPPGSVAVKVMVSLPFQLALATVMVATRAELMETLRAVFPL